MTYPFVLGTAQLGNHYGITNMQGCPNDEEVDSLLKFSLEKGIHTIDSAFAYGASIGRISGFFSKNMHLQPQLINKFSVLDNFDQLYLDLLRVIKDLGGRSLCGLLVHDPLNINVDNEGMVRTFFERLQKENLVEKVGVSIYDAKDLKYKLDGYPIDIIQLPLNLFDQRMLESGLIMEFKQRNIEIHGRSLFLQGVLLANTLPNALNTLHREWNHYRDTLNKIQMTPLHFICSWIKSIKDVDKWVIGVNNNKELQQILQAYDDSTVLEDYDWSTLSAPHNIAIDPRTWSLQ